MSAWQMAGGAMRPPQKRITRTVTAGALYLALLGTAAVAQRVPRAVPVEDKPPMKAIPVDPVPPKAQAVADPNRPSGADEDLFDYATLCYTQQDYKIAITPYNDYTRNY